MKIDQHEPDFPFLPRSPPGVQQFATVAARPLASKPTTSREALTSHATASLPGAWQGSALLGARAEASDAQLGCHVATRVSIGVVAEVAALLALDQLLVDLSIPQARRVEARAQIAELARL